ETLATIVDHAAPEHKLKIVFACRTGIRQGEMLALKIFDKKKPLEGGIDFASNKVLIRKIGRRIDATEKFDHS
ncbi:MAG: hypothetical protein ABGX07_06160, partial [Pirellulaceae bacterium]